MKAYLRQNQKISKYLAFDSSKLPWDTLFIIFLLLMLVNRQRMSPQENISKKKKKQQKQKKETKT